MPNLSNASASIQLLEQLSEGKTIIHRIHPLSKLLTTVFYLIIVLSFPRYSLSGLLPLAFYPILLMAFSETPYKPLLQRILIVFPFSFFAAICNLFFENGTAFFLGSFEISMGMISFLSIMVKTFLTVAAIFVLAATTPITKLSNQLIRLKFPKILVIQLNMTYRYIGIFIEETFTMVEAYGLRSPKSKGIHMKDMGVLIGQLILRSIDRCERVYQAMKCRGFNGGFSTCKYEKFSGRDYIYLLIICLCLLTLRFYNLSVLFGSFL